MKTILIVDDEDKIRNIYGRHLEAYGFKVLGAANTVEAGAALKEQPIDLVLLDINMGQARGDEFFGIIALVYREVKVIVTSVYSVEDQKRLIDGAFGYHDKADGFSKLMDKINKSFGTQSEECRSGIASIKERG
jgi:DNA-binding NtrC family response regulator